MNNEPVTASEMRNYKALRKLANKLGGDYETVPRPRITGSIKKHGISREFYQECLEAEMDTIRMLTIDAQFTANCATRDINYLENELKYYRDNLE